MERTKMTRADALQKASECEQMAMATSDPDRQSALRHMRQLWLTLAERGDELGQDIFAEFDRLMAVQAEINQDTPQ